MANTENKQIPYESTQKDIRDEIGGVSGALKSTESTSRNVADILAEELARIAGHNASQVDYDNSTSQLSADDVQEAIDELASEKVDKEVGKGLSTNDYTTAEKTKLAGIEAGAEVNPTSGAKTATESFETVDGGLLSKCMIDLVPVQDLHGYENPWVGGAGKNKLPLVLADIKSANTDGTWSGNAYTANGTTFTVNTDDEDNVISIDVANAPSATTAFIVYTSSINPFDTNLSYILNGCPRGGGASTRYKLDFIYEKNGNLYTLLTDTGSSAQEAFSQLVGATSVMVRIVIYTNASLPKTFYPMLRLATESDPTFEPYSNICPISGHTEVDLLTEGKNLLENVETVESHSSVSFTKNPDGSVYAKGTVGQNVGYYVFTNETNSLSLNNVTRFKAGQVVRGTTGSGRTLSVRYSDGVYDSIPANTAYTLHKDVVCVYVQFNAGTTVDELITPMIWSNVEDTDPTYEPYLGHFYTVQIGSTVYSGYVDLVSGVMVVVKMCETITSVSAIWQSGGHSFRAFVSQAHTQPTSGSSVDVFGMSNRFSQVSANQAYQSSKDFSFSIDRDATRVSLCFDASVTTVALANQYLAQNPVQICYELATPITIQLTPQQIEALPNQNNLSTPLSGQSIETNGVEYKELFTFADVKSYVDKKIPDAPTTDGTYTLQAVVSGGVPTYSWT